MPLREFVIYPTSYKQTKQIAKPNKLHNPINLCGCFGYFLSSVVIQNSHVLHILATSAVLLYATVLFATTRVSAYKIPVMLVELSKYTIISYHLHKKGKLT